MLLVAALLLVPALANGFPLVFPDSGTYLGIATGHDYAIDRSSVYGLLLRPFVRLLPGTAGLWLAIAAQAAAVTGVLLLAARTLIGATAWRQGVAIVALIPLTSLAWHAGQIMPDAFTGPLVLLVCLAATRPAGGDGTGLLWLGALLLALTHYTHVVLLGAAAGAAIVAQAALGLGWRAAFGRLAVAAGAAGAAIALLTAANAVVLGRSAMSPVGPVFLFARLNADGLAGPWLARHCGTDAPPALCAERARLPRDSQALLWGDGASPIGRHIWQAASDAERWRWVEMLAAADCGIVTERPLAFAASALRGTVRQFLAFRAIDDECPEGCGRNRSGGIAYILGRDRPTALPALLGSAQVRGTTPKAAVRAITTPVTAMALALLPLALVLAWRRRDGIALAFAAGIGTALIVNAALAGALSDVHDRYQSRVAWLAPLLILFLALRWRRARPAACPPASPAS
ncbi:hypothetical protein [Sphingomonas solaris]|uniref:Glycosyltransferase RgtA/B/C/D-like domain-containing protein n=1 Tax=Alterirhizorhabdus solaris TaxID=2529389 RepID=A0A558R1M9_9SPHN|nr:hypothetical protein [Sphingomonas solaris]TVV73283.1 hypothetical protein FOY91_12595 [Sphingomonas solaris]